jgi:phosphatidate cytidylyltransferase
MWRGGYYLFGLVLLVSTISYWEFVRLAAHKGAFAQLILGELFVIVSVCALFFNLALLIPILFIAITLFLFVELYRKKGSPLLNLGATLFGGLFFSLMFGSFMLIHNLASIHNIESAEIGQWILLLILSIWACDSAAMIIGSYFGRRKLMPRISPNKSIEGTVAGFLFGILAAYICHIWFIDDLSPLHSMAIGAIGGSFGQYGDLFESMLKRDAGVKDSSNLIPGHGGMMDRFDSLTISAPIMYLYLVYFVF